MISTLLLVTSPGVFGVFKVAPAELARVLAESSAVMIATPGRSPFEPHVEEIVCRSAPFNSGTQLQFLPPLSHTDRETEETYYGTKQRMVLLLRQAGGSWDLVSRHFGWIPLIGHKVTFRRFDPRPDPLKRYTGHDFLRIENDLLLPGNLAQGDVGSLKEDALLAWARKSFATSHRFKS